MAIISSTLNGISFVLQKKGILDVEVKMLREGKEVKEGHVQYLKSFVWWSGTGCSKYEGGGDGTASRTRIAHSVDYGTTPSDAFLSFQFSPIFSSGGC